MGYKHGLQVFLNSHTSMLNWIVNKHLPSTNIKIKLMPSQDTNCRASKWRAWRIKKCFKAESQPICWWLFGIGQGKSAGIKKCWKTQTDHVTASQHKNWIIVYILLKQITKCGETLMHHHLLNWKNTTPNSFLKTIIQSLQLIRSHDNCYLLFCLTFLRTIYRHFHSSGLCV